MSITDFAEQISPFVQEYGACELELRKAGTTLAAYVQCALRDNDPGFNLTREQSEFCDALQERQWGAIYEQSFGRAG